MALADTTWDQEWTAIQRFKEGITLENSVPTAPLLWLGRGFVADNELFSIVDTGLGGTIYVRVVGTGLGSDSYQSYQEGSGYFAIAPMTGGTPVLGNVSDPPAAGGIGWVARTAQAAAIAATNLTDGTLPGLYEISYYASTTTANVADGTIGLRLAYTDRVGATTQDAVGTLTLAATSTGTTALKGVMVVYLASGNNITYETILTGAQTTSRYAIEIRAKYLG